MKLSKFIPEIKIVPNVRPPRIGDYYFDTKFEEKVEVVGIVQNNFEVAYYNKHNIKYSYYDIEPDVFVDEIRSGRLKLING